MSAFKGFFELVLEPGQVDGLHRIRTTGGEVIIAGTFRNEDNAQRLVDCWNACRKLYNPANHINETEEYVRRLETLRKEAWARAETLESGAGGSALSPSLAAREADESAVSHSHEAGWNRDLSQAPTDGSPIWAASKCGKIIKSYWVPAPSPRAGGRWAGFSPGEQPVAWQPFVIPVHPGIPAESDVAA